MEQQPSMPAEKPRLMLVGLGGTILSRPEQDSVRGTIYRPSEEGLIQLRKRMGPRESSFASVATYLAPKIIDSAKARLHPDIDLVVQGIRKNLQRDVADAFIVFYGTDTMPDLMAALGNGISKEELGDKSVIVTCAMLHQEHNDSDAFDNLLRSVELATMNETRGKIGLVFNDRFFPPRGIEKRMNAIQRPFLCRFHRMAKYEYDESGELRWEFDRAQEPWDVPIGTGKEKYRLMMGVQPYELTSSTRYDRIGAQIRLNDATILLAPGGGNVRTDRDSLRYLKRACANARGPVIAVGNAVHTGEDILPEDTDYPDAKYEGDPEFLKNYLIPGGEMTPTEARVFVSEILTDIKNDTKLRKLKKKDQHKLVQEKITKEYPFWKNRTEPEAV